MCLMGVGWVMVMMIDQGNAQVRLRDMLERVLDLKKRKIKREEEEDEDEREEDAPFIPAVVPLACRKRDSGRLHPL